MKGAFEVGKQIRFFMGPEDEKKFLEMVFKKKDLLVRPKFKDRNIDSIDPKEASLVLKDYQYFIISEQSRIITRDPGYINEIVSDTIVFSRCIVKDGSKMNYGRLWVELKYWGEHGEMITKDKRLSDCYEFYRKWIKKHYRISKDKNFYIGEEAYKLYQDGKMKMISPPKYVVEFD